MRLLLVHSYDKRYYDVRSPRITSTGIIKLASTIAKLPIRQKNTYDQALYGCSTSLVIEV